MFVSYRLYCIWDRELDLSTSDNCTCVCGLCSYVFHVNVVFNVHTAIDMCARYGCNLTGTSEPKKVTGCTNGDPYERFCRCPDGYSPTGVRKLRGSEQPEPCVGMYLLN